MILSPRNTHWLGMAIVGLIAAGVVALCFSFVLIHPNNYFFSPAGDGIQSYYATAYYAFYDKGVHFSGMNYPFGENFTYPNLQSLIAWGLSTLQRAGIPAAKYTVAVTNLLALLSVVATPVILYAIMRRTRMPVWYAGLLAILIGFLSPQIQRLGPHMSLSYTCVVPMIWYCIMRMQEAPRQLRWYLLFGVISILTGLVMVYFLTCACFFLLAHVVVLALQRQRPVALLWRMTLTALLPLLLFQAWLLLTDTTTDRPPNPYGFLVYMATPAGVFTPSLSPFRELWATLFHTEQVSYEAMSYVGLVATGVLLASIIGFGQRWWTRRKTQRMGPLLPLLPAQLHTSLGAATLLLLFSFGVPFIFPGFAKLVDYTGPLRQFRALGRFAWPFYYVFAVYAAYYLYRLFRYQRQHHVPVLALPWLPMLLLLWASEAWINISAKAKEVKQGAGASEYFATPNSLVQQLRQAQRQPSDFQAIMPLPYRNKGSDKIDIDGSDASVYQTHKLSLATGLPQLSSYVSRPSVERVLRNVQLMSSPLIEKPLLKQFPSNKPILLLVTPNDVLSSAEQRVLGLAKLLVTSPEANLYELPVAALAATTLQEERAKALVLIPQLSARSNGLYCTTTKGVLRESFDASANRRGRLSPGAFYEPAQKFSVLYDGPLPTPADTGRYEVSVWVNGKMDYGIGNMQVKQYANGNQVDHQTADGRLCTEIQGDWLRIAVSINVQPGVNRIEVLYDSRDLLADDLLIRPLDTDVYWFDTQHEPVLNGYPLNVGNRRQ